MLKDIGMWYSCKELTVVKLLQSDRQAQSTRGDGRVDRAAIGRDDDDNIEEESKQRGDNVDQHDNIGDEGPPRNVRVEDRMMQGGLCESSISSRSALYEQELQGTGNMGGSKEDINAAIAMVQTLFKIKKFILSDEEMASNGVVARGFCTRLGVPEQFRKGWWEGVHYKVRKALDKKRNSACQAIKEAFMGK